MNENIRPDHSRQGRAEIEIALGDLGDTIETVTAFVVGDFAYRPLRADDEDAAGGQIITHVRTGRKLAWWFDSENDARSFLLALKDYLEDVGVDAGTSDVARVRELLRPHRRKMEKTAFAYGGSLIHPERGGDE